MRRIQDWREILKLIKVLVEVAEFVLDVVDEYKELDSEKEEKR